MSRPGFQPGTSYFLGSYFVNDCSSNYSGHTNWIGTFRSAPTSFSINEAISMFAQFNHNKQILIGVWVAKLNMNSALSLHEVNVHFLINTSFLSWYTKRTLNAQLFLCSFKTIQWCVWSSQSALGPRGNYGPSPLILRGLWPALGRLLVVTISLLVNETISITEKNISDLINMCPRPLTVPTGLPPGWLVFLYIPNAKVFLEVLRHRQGIESIISPAEWIFQYQCIYRLHKYDTNISST